MTKILLPFFNFAYAKQLLEILGQMIKDPSIEGNMFSHSSNPLLNMCLLYELLQLLIKKFYSLNNICKTYLDIIMNMMLTYIDSVDDENFLTMLMMEEDFQGRDSLRIGVELEILELI